MSDNDKNDLFYVCSLIEYVGRKTKNRRGDVVAAMNDECLRHQLEYADVNHCLPFERVSDELIAECGKARGQTPQQAKLRFASHYPLTCPRVVGYP